MAATSLCLAVLWPAATTAGEPQKGDLQVNAPSLTAPLPPDATFLGAELVSYQTSLSEARGEEQDARRWPERQYVVDGAYGGHASRGASEASPYGYRSVRGGWEFGGWLDQGISGVANNPTDRFNGVVGFDDRDGEYQMSQLWLYLERETPLRGCGWSWGGRLDVVYGTDAQFTQANDGLEASWDQTERFYRMALPQFYLDFAYNDWTLRVGHFITPLGYESYMAPDNFFYSMSYLYTYAVPGTNTGMTLRWDFADQWMVFAGPHRGSDQFDDTDGLNALCFLGGIRWSRADDSAYLDFAVDASEKGPGQTETIFTLVSFTELTKRWSYMIEYDWGQNTRYDEEWYGINQNLVYEFNSCWSAGMRFEWFRDDDGAVVRGLRQGNVAQGPFVGNFYELTLGLRWDPRPNLIVRPEIRWDWYNPDSPGGPLPFDSGDSNSQFLFAVDAILLF